MDETIEKSTEKSETKSFAKKLVGESARGALGAPSFIGETIRTGFNFLKEKPKKKAKE